MSHYFVILATISISLVHASEEKKHSSSFDTCPGLGFKSTDIRHRSGVEQEV